MAGINKHVLINIFVLVLFMVLTFVVGIYHEPWADEAQSWLIARDSSFWEILKLSKYEGTPALWFYILKILNLLHFPYKYFSLIPWVIGSIGTALLLFKSKLPGIVKYLFPFTFFPFFQYSVVGRNHSLFFPVLAIIAVLFTKRLQRPYLYVMLLILLACVSAYGFVIAFILFGFFTFEIIKENDFKIKKYIPVAIASVLFLIIAALTGKPDDCVFAANFDLSRLNNPLRLGYIMLRGFFNTPPVGVVLVLQAGMLIALYVSAAFTFCKTKKQVLFFIVMNFILGFLLTIIYCKEWHSGYLICTFIFTCWALAEENYPLDLSFRHHKVFYTIITFILLTHILWTVKSSVFDIKNSYSGSKAAAEYIKTNKLDNQQITGLGFHVVGLQPYFDKNIFSNLEHSYWVWDKKSDDEYRLKSLKLAPVVVVAVRSVSDYQDSINTIQKYYTKIYKADGELYAKGERKEYTTFVIYKQTKKEY